MIDWNKIEISKVEKKAIQVEMLADRMRALTDEELQAKTNEFRQRLYSGESLDDIMIEAMAVCREADVRVRDEFPYKVQIMGAVLLHQGDVAEMRTGEGKTLTATMAVYLNALEGKGVHIVTVNEYLAQRDYEEMGKVYRFLGLSVGVNLAEMTMEEKRAAYACDVTFSTNSELGFDYLRDNMAIAPAQRCQRGLNFVLIDEVDSILIDEARTPLIISGVQPANLENYVYVDSYVKSLNEHDYDIDTETKAISLSESGIKKAETMFSIENLYDEQYVALVHLIRQSLRANYVMEKDVEYIVQEDEILIVDQFTGRVQPGRQFSHGLHQALQAKEGVTIHAETKTVATITYQNFFRIYDKLAGMTGTAKTEEEEFLKIYNMRVLEVPTNRAVIREDKEDLIYKTKESKFEAIVRKIRELHDQHIPVLVGTASVENNEYLSGLLKEQKIPHEILNAKNHMREAEIIAKAGELDAVTIATNMAGRGTDIKLSEETRALGGLYVIGTERHESRRIDNQLRGRSGRQGDPGTSQFYLSLEDDLLKRFGGERLKKVMDTFKEEPLESKLLTKIILSSQKRVEGTNYDARKNLIEYDSVINTQRKAVFSLRNAVLEGSGREVREIYFEQIHKAVDDILSRHAEQIFPKGYSGNRRKKAEISSVQIAMILRSFQSKTDILDLPEEASLEGLVKEISESYIKYYENKVAPAQEQIYDHERMVLLRVMDSYWQDHCDAMSDLRQAVSLRSYAQLNPLIEYQREAYAAYDEMNRDIARDILYFTQNLKVEPPDDEKGSLTDEAAAE